MFHYIFNAEKIFIDTFCVLFIEMNVFLENVMKKVNVEQPSSPNKDNGPKNGEIPPLV